MSLPQETDLELIQQHVKKEHGKFKGLLVRQKFAERFLDGDPQHRKVYEIRSKQCRTVLPGEKIVLISIVDNKERKKDWVCLAVLEFQGNVKILRKDFAKHYPLHQVTLDELQEFQDEDEQANNFCWGWHFELHHELETCPRFQTSKRGAVIWVNFSLEDLGATVAEPPPSLPLKRSFTLEPCSTPSKRLKNSGTSTSLSLSLTDQLQTESPMFDMDVGAQLMVNASESSDIEMTESEEEEEEANDVPINSGDDTLCIIIGATCVKEGTNCCDHLFPIEPNCWPFSGMNGKGTWLLVSCKLTRVRSLRLALAALMDHPG